MDRFLIVGAEENTLFGIVNAVPVDTQFPKIKDPVVAKFNLPPVVVKGVDPSSDRLPLITALPVVKVKFVDTIKSF
jgi:hypothetical protein